jgi:hypothetical protein
MLPSWKTIQYRGGLVTFRIPSDWVEEYEADGGGAFYPEKPNSGTLRLNVMTLRSPSPIDARTTEALLLPRAQSRGLSGYLRRSRMARPRDLRLHICIRSRGNGG